VGGGAHGGPARDGRGAARGPAPRHARHPGGRLEKRTVDAWEDFHAAAEARRIARAHFAEADALLLPTAPGAPTLAALEAGPIAVNSRLGTYTNFANICDLSDLAVPAGFRPDGAPFGVTLLGPAFAEARLAGLGAALHHAAGGAAPPTPTALAAEEVPLLAIGAHMAGLPLNGQLRGHGARFLRAARTAPVYRLLDLGNRPGMVRVAEGEGVAVEGELWALPAASVGPFLAEIPPPLGFGRVALEDGSTPLGFLAEAAGVAGAPDISAAGGWRAHLARRAAGRA
jgi:allophanate hydrolase